MPMARRSANPGSVDGLRAGRVVGRLDLRESGRKNEASRGQADAVELTLVGLELLNAPIIGPLQILVNSKHPSNMCKKDLESTGVFERDGCYHVKFLYESLPPFAAIRRRSAANRGRKRHLSGRKRGFGFRRP